MMLYKCETCGYIFECEVAPTKNCKKCNESPNNFKELNEEESKKIYTSDRTNDIYAEIIAMLMKINKLSVEGEKIKLDEPCFKLFTHFKDVTWTMKQLAKAEMESHMKKGKW